MKLGQPLVMYATANVACGMDASLDAEAFQPEERQPFTINELRFRTEPPTAATTFTTYDDIESGLQFLVQMYLGPYPLTDGFVPLATLCPRTVNRIPVAGCSQYRVVLPKPLVVPPSTPLVITLRRRASTSHDAWLHVDATNSAIPVHVSAAGRYLPSDRAIPRVLNVPYFLGWAQTLADGSSDITFASPETVLKNRLASEVAARMMVGRLVANAANYEVDCRAITTTGAAPVDDPTATPTLVKITSNYDARSPVPTLMPFNSVFDRNWRSFPFKRMIAPNERISVEGIIPVASGGSGNYKGVQIGIVSSRKEKIL